MKIEEVLGALAAGLAVGLILALIEKQFPSSGVGRV